MGTHNSCVYLLQCSDVTEIHELSQELKLTRKSIQTTSDFISNLAHEIRTPLNGILGMLQYLNCLELSNEQYSCVNIALNSSHALSHLLSDVLDMSKIQAGELSTSITPISVGKLTLLME